MHAVMTGPVWKGSHTGTYTVWFGGSYQENWTEDYTLSIVYHDRRAVTAAWDGERWEPVDGDRVLVQILREPHCPVLIRQYFQAAASVYAAARSCVESGVELSALPERFYDPDNPRSYLKLRDQIAQVLHTIRFSEDVEIPENYVEKIKRRVRNKINYCYGVLDNDFYSYVFD